MSERVVKLQRFVCVRRADGQEAECEKVLRAAGAKYHGADWPEVERFYEIWHHEQGAARRFTALTSIYEHVVLCG